MWELAVLRCWAVLPEWHHLSAVMQVIEAQKRSLEIAASLPRSHMGSTWAVTKMLISSGENRLISSMVSGTSPVGICYLWKLLVFSGFFQDFYFWSLSPKSMISNWCCEALRMKFWIPRWFNRSLSLLVSVSCTSGNSWLLKTVMQMKGSNAVPIGGS